MTPAAYPWPSVCGRGPAGRTLTAVLLAAALAGCESAKSPASPDAAGQPVVRTADRGPITLTVTVADSEISIAQRVALTVTVEAEPGIEVHLPQFGDALNEFAIRDFHEDPVTTNDAGRRVYTQRYDLDIFLSGEYTIPAMTVQYADRRDEPQAGAPDAAPHVEPDAETPPTGQLRTEPITVKVQSLLEGEFDPQNFRDVKDPVAVAADHDWRSIAEIGALVGGVAGVIVALLLWLRRRQAPVEVVVPPYEWVMTQLRELADARLIETGQVTAFYYRLSEIARGYIERRFGLMAPERTTEEFLDEMRTANVLPIEYQTPLMEFLEACDLVKYARHEPTTAEIEQVFNTARDFVERTRPAAPRAQEAAA